MEESKAKYKTVIKQSSAGYGLGLIGALIYFLQHSTGFWMGFIGVLKAFVWPVLVVYKLLEFLKL